jgi:hypothetical protein
VPGWTSQVRSSAWLWKLLIQPASWAVWTAAAVEAEADRDRRGETEHGAGAGGGGVGRVLEGGEQEDRGLEALAQDREEGHPDQGHGRAGRQRRGRLAFERAFDAAGVAPHPDDHVGDGGDGDDADDRLQALLLFLRQLFADQVEADADGGAEDDRDADPDPHLAHRVPAPLLDQEGRDDADDERGLDALSQSDYEGGNHA